MGFIVPGGDGGGAIGKIPPDGTPPGDGGTGGGGAAASTTINLANLPVTGGLIGFQVNLLFPIFDQLTKQGMIYIMDSTIFDTEEDCEIDFKIEEFEPGNQTTIHRVLLRYRDLGKVTFTLAVVSASRSDVDTTLGNGNAQIITIGNNGKNSTPTGKIYTFKSSIKVTTEAPQIKIFRKANSGPLSITKVKTWASYGDGDII